VTVENGVKVKIADKDLKKTLTADLALVAVGVQGNVENIGLEALGIKAEKGMILTNEFQQTNVPSIYAIGDVAGPPWLAHAAPHQGVVAADHIAAQKPRHRPHEHPGATYATPRWRAG
jgi:dihydrolipoamide dehydrogenase